jgi:hypothetical protein
MRSEERLPGHPLLSNGVESVIEKDPFDCVSCDFMTEIVERSSNSGAAPTRIVAGHSEDQHPDFNRSSWTSGASPLAPVILSRDQLTVPSEQSIWSHQGLDLGEDFPTDLLGLRRKAAALLTSKPKSFPAKLLPQGSVTQKLRFLLLEIFDHILLVSIDPASEDQHQKLKRQSVHRSEFRPSNLQEIG